MGRLDDLRRTIGAVAEQPQSTCVLVDYSCPDHAGAWVKEYYPDVRVVACEGRQRFRGAEARNIGAAAVDDDGILCFLDADVTPGPEFCRHVLSNFESGTFWVADREGPGLDTALACGKRDFDRAGGFDEAFMEWGQEVVDLRASLRRIGLREHTFSAALLSHPVQRHPAPVDNATIAVHAAYRRAKAAVLDESPDSESCLEALRTLLTPGWDTPPAAIAFREQMGYTIARLEAGASSHNNELRPFSTIPGALVGLVYTQVVANVTTPVEIEFLSAGKLYVLVGTEWWGGAIATAWLRESGHHELIPPVQTRLGTRFEVWSLAADVGGTAVLPNQVMLVARHLERR
jgi:hypothetical protein